MREWNQVDETIKNLPTVSLFKRELVRLVRPSKKPYFGINDLEGTRVQFSNLREHKFRHNFRCPSPMYLCQTGTMNTSCNAHATVN